MITERMLELVSLNMFLDRHKRMLEMPTYSDVVNRWYDIEAVIARRDELEMELLDPYVIDNAEKSE